MREESENCTVEVSIGGVSVEASAKSEEKVEEVAINRLEHAVDVAEDVGYYESDESYHLEGGAGWMVAHADGESPEEAYELWLEMWTQMIEDVKEMSGSEKEQAGIRR
jgi:hypothetical protein